MKLEKVLNLLNSLEKNSFLKNIDNIISTEPKYRKQVDEILESEDGQLKNADNANIAKIFGLISQEFQRHVAIEFINTCSHLDVLLDIIIRDGNCIMSREWFSKLYEDQIKELQNKIKEFADLIEGRTNGVDDRRIRDYKIYRDCLKVAYYNDETNNLEPKLTKDENTILIALAKKLELSQEEIRLINYMVVPLEKIDIDTVIHDLKNLGVIFYQKKTLQLYVADEVVALLRQFRGKEVADRHFRRVLAHLRDSQINHVCRRHRIKASHSKQEKINEIIKHGIGFSNLLLNEIFREGTSQTEIKNFLNNLIFKELKIIADNKGKTAEEKVQILIDYFEALEQDQKIGISYHGYDRLLHDLQVSVPEMNSLVKEMYKIQNEFALQNELLLDYNIKPRDVLYLLNEESLKKFCQANGISVRGDDVLNILDFYKDTENLLLENYDALARRDYRELKENAIEIRESEIGLKFEEMTKLIFSKLGFNVDEQLRKELKNSKNIIDIVLNLGNNELIIVECKTSKDSGYNKYSTVSRQIKSYMHLAEKSNYRVVKSLLIAPFFSDDFEKECGLEYELNLSLITSKSLKSIYDGFAESKHQKFPYKLLLRDVLIKEDRILKAIAK